MIRPIDGGVATAVEMSSLTFTKDEWILCVYGPLDRLGPDYHFIAAPAIGRFHCRTGVGRYSIHLTNTYKLPAEIEGGRRDYSIHGPARMEVPLPGMLSALITGDDIVPALRGAGGRVSDYAPFVERLIARA